MTRAIRGWCARWLTAYRFHQAHVLAKRRAKRIDREWQRIVAESFSQLR